MQRMTDVTGPASYLQVRMHMGKEGLIYERYPYGPATLFPQGLLVPADIAAVQLANDPPMVLTQAGELICVPEPRRERLAAFAHRHGLPCVQRADVWRLVLEPLLDTGHDREAERAGRAALAALGLDERALDALRARIQQPMRELLALTQEWFQVGLFDVLDAMSELPEDAFGEFYSEAMRLALLAPASPGPDF